MARTSLKPWKFVLDIGSLTLGSGVEWGRVGVAGGGGASRVNGDNLAMSFRSSLTYWHVVYSLERPRRGY